MTLSGSRAPCAAAVYSTSLRATTCTWPRHDLPTPLGLQLLRRRFNWWEALEAGPASFCNSPASPAPATAWPSSAN